MYESYFNLHQAPFNLTPNTHFFMPSESHAQALEMLLVGLQQGEGFMKVTGEVGTGKSLLCRMLLNSIEDQYVTAYIPNPSCSAETLYCLIADELKTLQPEENAVQGYMRRHFDSYFNESLTSDKQILALQQIQTRLLSLADRGKQVVLIIDEAQAMPHETIEALRLISNLETESRKLLQIVLFGQPELDDRLAKDNLRQLAQRISFQYRIKPLSSEATAAYVKHRIRQAGGDPEVMFESAALKMIARGSRGIPRLINILCHKALLLCYGRGASKINKSVVREAILDTPSASRDWFIRLTKPIARSWAAVILILPVASVWLAQQLSVLP